MSTVACVPLAFEDDLASECEFLDPTPPTPKRPLSRSLRPDYVSEDDAQNATKEARGSVNLGPLFSADRVHPARATPPSVPFAALSS